MKIFKLILFNIKKLYQVNRSMFCFIILGIMFASFGIMFYSGYFMSSYYNTTFKNELKISMSQSVDYNKLTFLLEKIKSERGFVRILAFSNSNYEDDVDIVGMYERDFQKHMLCGEAYSVDEEAPFAVLSEYSMDLLGYQENITGKTINKDDVSFEVVGIHSVAFGFCVPLNYYISNYPTSNIYAEFDTPISDELLNTLNNEDYIYTLIENESPFKSGSFLASLFVVVGVFCISFVNIIMVFSLWEIKMKPAFRIYYIYGCNRLQKFFIVSGEFFLISLIGMILGSSLFVFMYKLLGEFNIIYTESFTNYIFVILIVIFILFMFSIYFGYKNMIRQQKLFCLKE